MNLIPPDGGDSSMWPALGAGGLAALIYLRKFLSRQNVEVKKDSAEANLIKTLQEERDKAMAAAEKAWETRTADAKLIGELTSEVKALRMVNEEMRNQLKDMKQELDTVRLEVQSLMRDNNAAAGA